MNHKDIKNEVITQLKKEYPNWIVTESSLRLPESLLCHLFTIKSPTLLVSGFYDLRPKIFLGLDLNGTIFAEKVNLEKEACN